MRQQDSHVDLDATVCALFEESVDLDKGAPKSEMMITVLLLGVWNDLSALDRSKGHANERPFAWEFSKTLSDEPKLEIQMGELFSHLFFSFMTCSTVSALLL